MGWVLSSLLLLLYHVSVGLTQTSTNPEVVLHPDSRLIPVGTSALFTCKFRNVRSPYWDINGIKATNDFNKRDLMHQGYDIHQDSTNNDGIIVLTMTVNGSYPRINNSHIQCKTFSTIHSETATLLTIEEPPLSPNPIFEQPSASSLVVKWSPPFLWPGYFIKSYNISIQNHKDRNVLFRQVNSTSFRDAVVSFSFSPHHQIEHCTNFTFGITPLHHQYANQTYYATGYLSAPGNFNVSATVFFRADGTPLVRALVKPSYKICSYQKLNIAVNITDRSTNAVVTREGPIPHRGNDSFEYDIKSSSLKREHKYLMTVTVNTAFESSTNSYPFNTSLDPNLYPTNPPCNAGKSANKQNTHLFAYKVAMGICLGLAVLMLFMLVSVLLCFLIHRQRKISQGKALNVSTNRVQNAMVHNPIYDGPVYESVQPHFDTLTTSVKQDLSLSNTSASSSPRPGSSTPPNAGNSNNSQKMARYLDRPIQPRSQSLSHPSTPDNNNPRSTSVCAQSATRVMGLKKNGKERNKLHLTLTLNGNESADPACGAPNRKEEAVLVGDLPGNGGNKRAVTSDGDENYTVMSPIKRKDNGNIGMTELSPEDTDKYKEEVN